LITPEPDKVISMEQKKFYITTTLPYVNDVPHLGHALEFIQADVLARLWRLRGSDVFFNTGTDEHGQKIREAAQKSGEDVQQYVDRYAESFKNLCKILNISNDAFIRTTDDAHIAAAQEIWRRCGENGDIEKRTFRGLYCVGCEKLLTERDLEGGRCPLHPNREPEEREEENYFFRLSKYQDELLAYLESGDVIVPAHRLEEAKKFVREGLEDFSISREKERMEWGVPVPDDDTQVMYVWFDALTNYISTLGWPDDKEGNFKKFWEDGETLQIAGKDQVRFQSLMWQAMLMSAGLPTTKKVFYHGFITSGGQKMSKSIGNVISPLELVDKYGTDATRYILLRHVHPTDDTDVTWERLDEWYTAGLVNGLGNLVARIMKLSEDNEVITLPSQESYPEALANALASFEFNEALNYIWSRIQRVDQKVTEDEPFKVIKSDPAVGKAMIQELVNEVRSISVLLEPFMPETAKKIQEAIKENKKPENLFPRK